MSATAGAVSDAVNQLLKSDRRNAYAYPVPAVASIAASGVSAQIIQFEVDSIFVWTKTQYHVDLSGAAITESTVPVPLVTVQLQDTATQRTLFLQPVPLDTMAGNLGLPFILPAPQVVLPASTYKVSYVNFSAATTYTNLQLVLHGYKYYGKINAAGELTQTS